MSLEPLLTLIRERGRCPKPGNFTPKQEGCTPNLGVIPKIWVFTPKSGGHTPKPRGFGVKCCRLLNILDLGFYFCKVCSIFNFYFVCLFVFFLTTQEKNYLRLKKPKECFFKNTFYLLRKRKKEIFLEEFSHLGQSCLLHLLPEGGEKRKK